MRLLLWFFFFFFFQAEDGIRDIGVTGVQTCALPISDHRRWRRRFVALRGDPHAIANTRRRSLFTHFRDSAIACARLCALRRSEERRVGKECRSRWWPDH